MRKRASGGQKEPQDSPQRLQMAPRGAPKAPKSTQNGVQNGSQNPSRTLLAAILRFSPLFAPSRVQNESPKRPKKSEKRRQNARVFLRAVFTDFACRKSSKTETDFDRKNGENLKRRFLENRRFTMEKRRFSRFGPLKNDRKPQAKSIQKHTRF